jgi:hypothetical protein
MSPPKTANTMKSTMKFTDQQSMISGMPPDIQKQVNEDKAMFNLSRMSGAKDYFLRSQQIDREKQSNKLEQLALNTSRASLKL